MVPLCLLIFIWIQAKANIMQSSLGYRVKVLVGFNNGTQGHIAILLCGREKRWVLTHQLRTEVISCCFQSSVT
jgi:hypothetical protein